MTDLEIASDRISDAFEGCTARGLRSECRPNDLAACGFEHLTSQSAPAVILLDVASGHKYRGACESGGGVEAQDRQSRPGSERVAGRDDGDDLASGVRGHVVDDVVAPGRGQQIDQRGRGEQYAEERREGAGGVADEGAEPEAKQADGGEVQPAADGCSERVGLAERRAPTDWSGDERRPVLHGWRTGRWIGASVVPGVG